MVDDNGNPINALYGFCRFIGDFMENVTPEYVAVLFDESLSKSFRTEIYPEYKANRDPAPEDLKRQFEQCRRYVRALGVMECASPRYEADDLIGTLVTHGRKHGRPSTIVTRDKDLTQLLQQGRRVLGLFRQGQAALRADPRFIRRLAGTNRRLPGARRRRGRQHQGCAGRRQEDRGWAAAALRRVSSKSTTTSIACTR